MKLQDIFEGEVIQGKFPQNGKVLVSSRRDVGDEWKYWNGVNWFAVKKNAREVEAGKVETLVSKWGLNLSKRTAMGEVRTEQI